MINQKNTGNKINKKGIENNNDRNSVHKETNIKNNCNIKYPKNNSTFQLPSYINIMPNGVKKNGL